VELERPLRAWIGRRAPPDLDVDDLVQDTFLRLHRALPALRDLRAAEAVAWSTARSVLVDHLRRRRPAAELPDDLVHEPDAPTGATSTVASWLPAFVDALPEPYAQAVRWADLEGVSQAEVARRLGLSPSGARTRVQRGRAQLRELLLACCEVRFENGDVVDIRRRDECGGCS
jgi:RNA polymerase sigma-70 factor (ECF subfamily)